MEKEVSSTGYVDHTSTTQSAAANDVFRVLKENFYCPQRIEQMPTIDETIKTSGDKYTMMVPRQGAGSSERLTSKILCDPGLDVRQEEAGFRIIGIRNNSSALFSEVMNGDLIISANRVAVNNLKPGSYLKASTTHWFKELLTGNKGACMPASIETRGGPKKVHLQLSSARRYAELTETGRDDIRAIHIDKFTSNTYADVSSALRSCNPWKLRGVILDLRGNGGGTLESAVDVSSLFIGGPGKEVMNEVRREGFRSHITKQPAQFADIAVGLLVDEESASASEILVGSLKHHKNSLVMGQKTFGKGSVQAEFAVPSVPDQRLKLTTSQWMTPSGENIHGKGFKPHIYIDDVRVSSREKIDAAMEIAVQELAHELPKRNPKKQRYRSQY